MKIKKIVAGIAALLIASGAVPFTNNIALNNSVHAQTSVLYDTDGYIAIESDEPFWGDVNCDGEVTMEDYEALLSYLSDNFSYPLSEQGKINADVCNPGDGLDLNDAEALLRWLNGLISGLPVNGGSFGGTEPTVTVWGDANCDGEVTIEDCEAVVSYLKDPTAYPLSKQGMVNADVLNPGSGIDVGDVAAILLHLSGNISELPMEGDTSCGKYTPFEPVPVWGDVNCDGEVTFEDAELLKQYINDKTSCHLGMQSRLNADVCDPGNGIDVADVDAIAGFVAGTIDALPVLNGSGSSDPMKLLFGDANCDGKVTVDDCLYILNYLNDPSAYPLSEYGDLNADVCDPDSGVDDKDVAAILLWLCGDISGLPVKSSNPGDANCDGEISMADAVLIMQAQANPDKYGVGGSDPAAMTAEGAINGDVYGNDGITARDALSIQKYMLKLIDSLPEE